MTRLLQIQETVRLRAAEIASVQPGWPCRKGCDECCRRLASAPRVTRQEWAAIAAALDALPSDSAALARRRIRDLASASRPITCPLLDAGSGACLVYEARPVACRAYGFYAERRAVLGCSRIEAISQNAPDVVWGNHEALENELRALGPAAEITDWLASETAG